MTLLEQVAPGAIGPGVASAVVFAGAWLAGRRDRRPFVRDAMRALAVVAGFAVGFVVVNEAWPALPLSSGTDATYWLAWFAVGGWLLGLLELVARVPGPVRILLRAAISMGAAWLLTEPLVPHTLEASAAWGQAAAAAVGMTLLWSVAAGEVRAEESPGRVALPFTIIAGTTAAILAFLSGSLSLGQTTGGLSAAVGAAFGLGWLLKTPATSRATAPILALVLGGLLLAAYGFLNDGDSIYFPWTSAALLVAGAVGGVYLPRLALKTESRWATLALGALPPLVFSAAAAWLAHVGAPPPNPYAY